ncbi:MAG: murein hydrolase activator EnvC family protein [Spirochaetaceae bacterium]
MGNPVKRLLLAGLAGLFLSGTLSAWDWPMESPVIAVSFAQVVAGDYSRRLDLTSSTDEVRAAHDGEIIFRRDTGRPFHAVPGVLGNVVVLDHGQGFRSVYAHLGEVSIADDLATVSEGQPIGAVGGSGYSSGEFLGFYVEDRELSSFVNPLVLLPEREDRLAPVIGEVIIESQGGREVVTPALEVSPGRVSLFANVYDPNPGASFPAPLPPYLVRAFVDGRQVFDLALESIQVREGRLIAGSDYTLPLPPRPGQELPLGETTLLTGTSVIEIVAEDYAGNRAVRSVEIQVRTTP